MTHAPRKNRSLFQFALCAVTLVLPARAQQVAPKTTQPSLSLTVTSPDGHPAIGALAVLVPPDRCAEVTDGRAFDDDPAYIRATAGEKGRIAFASLPPTSYLLVVIHSSGSLQLNREQLQGKTQIELTAWGQLHGRRSVGGKPGIGRKIVAWCSCNGEGASEPDSHAPTALFISNATVDTEGLYQIDRFPPGQADVAPADPTNWGAPLERPMRVVNVTSGKSTELDMGGQGRALVGHVTLPAQLSNGHDWAYWFCVASPDFGPAPSPMPTELALQPLTRQIAWWTAFNQTPAAAQRDAAKQQLLEQTWAHTYPFDIQPDGSFRIDDVEPGNYRIHFDVLAKKVGSAPRVELGRGHAEITVDFIPGGRSDHELELAPIALEPTNDVTAGDPAPDFTAMGLDDQPLQLSKFRGKYVLLQFWATWCGPCVQEMDNVKAVYEKFGKDPRFAMIGLSADETPDRPAHFADAHGLAWHQGFLGTQEDSPIENLYAVKGIPSIWLIGPDGKVIRKNLRGAELLTEVGKAMQE